MADRPDDEGRASGPGGEAAGVGGIAAESQRLINDFLARQGAAGMADPMNIGGAFLEMTAKMMADPAKLATAQMTLWHDYMRLWQRAAQRMLGEETDPVAAPEPGDRRFRDAAWSEDQLFDFIKQSYLLSARWLQSTVRDVEGLDDKTAAKVDFYTRQFVDAMAPSNFALTNPEVLRATVESNGENLVRGLENLLADLERGNGRLRIRMTDPDAFELGRNIALTPGKVVYQNALMQLVQYDPATETVHARPLLIVPPWINKYYILDLRPENSFVRWAVDRGYTVFVISWVNPDERLAGKSFPDYLREGPLEALEAIEKATGEREVTAIGYCLGGTLLACTLAHMAARGETRIKAATYFAAMVDFSEAGDLSVFIDEEQLSSLEERMKRKGYLEGADMAATFNMLRANDLIWSFVVNNYLLGKDPLPFDLLYWNSDSTRLPASMHLFYLRKMYQENLLIEPGGITLDGVPIDLRRIEAPTYILATREDHIAPWASTYAAARTYAGPVRFVLAASGHVAGIINPPAAGKYGYWTNPKIAATPEAWLEGARRRAGSWWPNWHRWNARRSGPKVTARTPGGGDLEPIEDAPGSYVKVRSN